MKNWNSITTITKHFTREDLEYYHTLSDLTTAVDSALSMRVIRVNVYSLDGKMSGQREYQFGNVESCGRPVKLDGTCVNTHGDPVSHGETSATDPVFCPDCSASPVKVVEGSEKWNEMPPPETDLSYCQVNVPYMAVWNLVAGQPASSSLFIPSAVMRGGVITADIFGTVDTHIFSKNLQLQSAVCDDCVY